MRQLTVDDLDRMQDAVLFTRKPVRDRLSKYWGLLILSGIIASAGIITDSTATVIGAMIVAPLMIPILGTALSLVLSSRRNVLWSVGLMIGGVLAVVALAFFFGLVTDLPLNPADNSQISGRINPTLMDLIAALATGTVGAFALVRKDIGDTLPGVAIAISLVPPLAVVGLMLETRQFQNAFGAFLLFSTNVAAILATGMIVFAVYGVRGLARDAGIAPEMSFTRAAVVIAALLLVIAAPLTAGSIRLTSDALATSTANSVVQEWTSGTPWELVDVTAAGSQLTITVFGEGPRPSTDTLREKMNDNGLGDFSLSVQYVPGSITEVPVSSS